MLAVISPAKKMDFSELDRPLDGTAPTFSADSKKLVTAARKLSKSDLQNLMKLSDSLADVNYQRFKSFKAKPDSDDTKPAAFAFAGDTYVGLEAATLSDKEISYAQDHLRILSGLYGLLRPLDLIQPYRLEMGTRWAPRHKALTDWWGDRIAAYLRDELATEGSNAILNLASQEYFAAVKGRLDGVRIIDVDFREPGPDGPRFVSFHAKKARGMMARWMCEHHVTDIDSMRGFDSDGYRFDAAESDADMWRFTRA